MGTRYDQRSTLGFFLASIFVLGSVAFLYAWLMLPPNVQKGSSFVGCQEDNEGSWSIGVFYGDSPFSLKPIEAVNIWKNESAAWPVSNPVVTCASVSDAGFPSNFVADPFIYVQIGDEVIYGLFMSLNLEVREGRVGDLIANFCEGRLQLVLPSQLLAPK